MQAGWHKRLSCRITLFAFLEILIRTLGPNEYCHRHRLIHSTIDFLTTRAGQADSHSPYNDYDASTLIIAVYRRLRVLDKPLSQLHHWHQYVEVLPLINR